MYGRGTGTGEETGAYRQGESARRYKEIPDKIKDANVFVLSSDFEGMPNAVAEAFAMGVPVVSTDCPSGGARMLVKEEETGLLVPVGNKEKMAEAILRILQDEKLAAHLRETAFALQSDAPS